MRKASWRREREAQILAGMASPGGPSIDYVLKGLASLDDESASGMLTRKVATALAAALDERVRAIEATEAAKDPAQRRREQEAAARRPNCRLCSPKFRCCSEPTL